MEIRKLLGEKISEVVKKEYKINIKPEDIDISHPVNKLWGDYSTNVAMKLSSTIQQAPGEIARKLSYKISESSPKWKIGSDLVEIFEKIEFQDPGFVNFSLSEKFLAATALSTDQNLNAQKKNLNIGQYRAKNVLLEYTDPNPFKEFHIGHLMTNAIGEALSRMYEIGLANVKRANYQGDVGLHVAKSVWGALKKMANENTALADLEKLSLDDRVGFFAEGYVMGSQSYEADESIKAEINQLNGEIYAIAQGHTESAGNPELKELYLKGRQWSLDRFEKMYDRLGTKFDVYYLESLVGEYGLKIVNEYTEKGVFKKDQGAVIFPGEDYGLHTRVFVNSQGLPIYEAKDLALAILKAETFDYDLSIIITANEVDEYFKVVLKAMEQIRPDLAKKTLHIGHGVMRFKEGKMSSRTGDIVSAEELINDVKTAVLDQMAEASAGSTLTLEEKEEISDQLAIGAVKYSILKHGLGRDIIFDKTQSISITGNTGPYLQYTHARANSILDKAPEWAYDPEQAVYEGLAFHEREKDVVRHISKFADIVSFALLHNSPNLICEYLFELAQHYNAFYNDLPILTEPDERVRNLRLQITKQVKDLLKTGLWILGIQAPDRV